MLEDKNEKDQIRGRYGEGECLALVQRQQQRQKEKRKENSTSTNMSNLSILSLPAKKLVH